MSRLAITAALALALAAVPAEALNPHATWAPTLAHEPVTGRSGFAAFPDGTGYVTGPTNWGFDTRGMGVPGVPSYQTLFRTDDYGLTWTPVPPGIPVGLSPHVAFTSPTTGWTVGPFEPVLARTTDGGHTWTQDAVRIPLIAGEEYRGTSTVGASPEGGALAVAAYTHQAGVPGMCWSDTVEAIFWSADDGATWAAHRFPVDGAPGSVRVRSVDPVDADTGVALAYPAECDWLDEVYVYLTNDGGTSWDRVAASPSGGITAATASADGTRIVLGYGNGLIRVSTDGGATFTTTQALADPLPLPGARADAVLDLAFRGGTGYATTANGLVWRTTDGGLSWTADGDYADLDADLALFDADHALAVGTGTVWSRLP